VIQRPPGLGAFQFVILATLRAQQLIRGCRPRVEGTHKKTVLAQIEVAEGHVLQMPFAPAALPPATVIDDALVEVAAAHA
jgi:hypothetical protein